MSEYARQAEYIRTRDAARYVGLSHRTLEKLRVTGAGPEYFKMGRAVVYAISELEAWLARNRRCSTSDTGRLSTAPLGRGDKL